MPSIMMLCVVLVMLLAGNAGLAIAAVVVPLGMIICFTVSGVNSQWVKAEVLMFAFWPLLVLFGCREVMSLTEIAISVFSLSCLLTSISLGIEFNEAVEAAENGDTRPLKAFYRLARSFIGAFD